MGKRGSRSRPVKYITPVGVGKRSNMGIISISGGEKDREARRGMVGRHAEGNQKKKALWLLAIQFE
jgi:hypothetical protein